MPWERQPCEPSASWHGFTAYRDLGPTRSCNKAAKKLGKNGAHFSELCRQNDWVARAAAWDAEVDRHHRRYVLAEQRKMFNRHLDIAKKIEKRAMEFIDISILKPEDAIRLLTVAIKLRQVTLGMPTEYTTHEISAVEKDPVEVYFDNLPESRLRDFVSESLNSTKGSNANDTEIGYSTAVDEKN